MDFAVNVPLNSVSFGQVSLTWLREIFKLGHEPCIFPVGNQVDLSTQEIDKDFQEWIQKGIDKALTTHSRKTPIIKLWHLNGSFESLSEKQVLFSFYELDSPTPAELNIAKNHTTVFSSEYSCEVFNAMGCDTKYIPLGYDTHNFKRTEKSYFNDGRIVFNIVGKVEKRKRHEKAIKAWAKKFGNNKKYYLQCAIYNPFFSEQDNSALVSRILEGQKYFNVNFLGFMAKNSIYNDFLNSCDIMLGVSGGEGWGLPEFHTVGLGKHAVILNAHSYKGWANESNSVMLNPSEKIDCYDGVFFKPNQPFNQGRIFDFDEDEFIARCEEAIERHESNPVNEEGLKIQDNFKVEDTVKSILELV